MTRYIIIHLTISLLIIGMFACAARNKYNETETDLSSEIRVYEVFGMDCPGCHGGLEKILLKNPEIISAEANWVKKMVTIRVEPDSKLSDEEVFAAIKRANFTPGKRIK